MRIRNKGVLIGLIAFIAVVIIALSGFLFYQINLQPVSADSDMVSFEVKEGDGANEVIARLVEADIIKNELSAKIYAKLNGLHEMKAGQFQLDRAWNCGDILRYLNDSGNAAQASVRITIPEGLWAKDIAARLEKELGISAQELLALWNDDAYLQTLINQYEFLDERILNDQTRVKLEGYLYPETYDFPLDATKEEVTETFLNQFAHIYEQYRADIEASGKSMHDVITLASLVQYEASSEADMKLIAGVFGNRLIRYMRLESSVTVCYALYEEYEHAQDCEVNADIDSPYNTYLYDGLPIGPILNPGAMAIDAVLHPTPSNYLFFMADIYGDGTVYYAETLEEHEANVERYLR